MAAPSAPAVADVREPCRIKIHDNRALPSAEDDEDNDNDSAAGEADATVQDNETGFKATKVNPYFLMLYGHIMAAGKSYHSALGESG